MKNIMSFLKSGWMAVLILTLLAGGLMLPNQTAAAESDSGLAVSTPTPRATPQYTALENLFKREQIALNNQQERITLSVQVITKSQQFIARQKAAGKDTSAIETALAAFSQAVSDTKTLHATAAGILSSHNGFDASGQVTDGKSAAQTVDKAGQPLREAHLKITQATLDFRQAMRSYIEANK